MDIEGWRRAITAAPLAGLDGLAKGVWDAWGVGALSDDEAGEACEMIAARRSTPPAPPAPRRSAGSRPRTSASVERRRAWTAGGWMPPAIAARFTMGEAAAVAAIVAEIALRGACTLHVGAIAARAGVSETTVRNGRRQAVRLGLLAMVEDRHGYDRSGPNRITILSRELALWVKTRARVEARHGWVQDRAADPQPSSFPLLSSASPLRRDKAFRGDGETGSTRAKPRPPAMAGSTPGPVRASSSGTSHRRVL